MGRIGKKQHSVDYSFHQNSSTGHPGSSAATPSTTPGLNTDLRSDTQKSEIPRCIPAAAKTGAVALAT